MNPMNAGLTGMVVLRSGRLSDLISLLQEVTKGVNESESSPGYDGAFFAAQCQDALSFLYKDTWLIDLHKMVLKYDILEQIEEGSSGLVYKGRHPETGQIVAVKSIFYHDRGGVPSSLIREIAILKEMDHPNIVNKNQTSVWRARRTISLVISY